MAITKKNTGNKLNFAKEIDDTLNNEDDYKKRKKGGRPSNGDVKKLSVSISADLYKEMEIGAALFFKGNKTAYINALIRKDLQENLEKYKEFQKIVQK